MSERQVAELLPLAPKDYHVLFVLWQGDLHGYAITKRIEERTDGLISLEPANLYRVLRRLERDGLVEEADTRPAADAGHERRRYYALTELGHQVLVAEGSRMRVLVREAADADLLSAPAERS